jgi:predicted SprT family Zn-dependent metalloprotease
MPSLRQLEFSFRSTDILSVVPPGVSPGELIKVVAQAPTLPAPSTATGAVALQLRGRDAALETKASELLRSLGAKQIATKLRVEWSSRLQTAAGRAEYRQKLISLNPRLVELPEEIDRTLRHELAHFVAQFRAGRRRISPHGPEWQQACRDLGIAGEKRCHTLPFPAKRHTPRFIYRCPNCRRDFPRVRKIKRTVACLACCRAYNGGEFHVRFRLRLVNTSF